MKNFVRALERRGYNLRNSQDGAHELYHAITCGAALEGGESRFHQREELNNAIEKKFPDIERWWNEVEARVVERLVCARLGTEIELRPFDDALRLSIEEAWSFGVPRRGFEESMDYALRFGTTKRAKAAVDLVLAYALAEARAPEALREKGR